MKVPTRRRRNGCPVYADYFGWITSMKVPARRRGNLRSTNQQASQRIASMKVPTRRRGNPYNAERGKTMNESLNESPARMQENKSIPKQPFRHSNTIDKPKHHASDTPTLRHVPGSRGDSQCLQRPLSPPPLPVRNRTRRSSAPLPRVASE